MSTQRFFLRWLFLFAISWPSVVKAGDGDSPKMPVASTNILATDPNRWLVVICTLPGDEEFEGLLSKSVKQIVDSASPVLGVGSGHVRVHLSSQKMAESLPGSKPCNRDALSQLSIELKKQLDADSRCFFVVLGHAFLDGRSSQLNIDGSDLDQQEYAKLFADMPGAGHVHWIAIPTSGYWIKPLSRKGTVVITATEADLEFTATEMPYALGAILAGEAENAKLEDIDKDGQLSLLDLYLAVSIEVQQRFVKEDFLQTEHSMLDDNGDGRGSELQEPYLPVKEEEQDKKPPPRKMKRNYKDGDVARTVLLSAPAASKP
jgi:hypothetical protein